MATCLRYVVERMRAEILTIGDELCRGEVVDTNSSYLAARLWDLGITTRWMTSCNDEEGDIAAALALATGRADLVVCSGGLGPTEDDLTVDVVSRAAGVVPVIDEPARARMLERFGRLLSSGQVPGQDVDELTRIQLRQVRVPTGARVHPNPVGLAPGFEISLGGIPVVCLPGVPRELYGIMDAGLGAHLAALREARGAVERVSRRIYRVFGRGESQISQACRGLVDGVPGATIHYQVKFPETLVKLVVRDPDQAAADGRLAALDAGLRTRLGSLIYGTGDDTLVEVVPRRLIAAGVTVATAESCTGGLLTELLTRTPGSSQVVRGGVIAYANAEKVRALGVAPRLLDEHGAVSEQVVLQMAVGAHARLGATLAVAISGIAGPDGGTPDKPVGTVYIAAVRTCHPHEDPANVGGTAITDVVTKKLSWPGQRDQIRLLAAWWALSLLDELRAREVAARAGLPGHELPPSPAGASSSPTGGDV